MGDFLLDLRAAETRRLTTARAAETLKFCDDTRVQLIERDPFSLVLTRVDSPDLWGPFHRVTDGGEIFVALAGRIALEELEWDAARQVEGEGGLACKAIYQQYQRAGANTLGFLDGNFAVLLYDQPKGKLHLVTDRCGMMACYSGPFPGQAQVLGSHPDVVASALGEEENWDATSLAQFIMTGCLTFPRTYYKKVGALDTGSIYTFDVGSDPATCEGKKACFNFANRFEKGASELELAEELASAFRGAVRRRTQPRFGTTAIALSGGLDSRAILAAAGNGPHIRAFTLYDEENTELEIARRIAAACGVKLELLRRDADFYGRTMEAGVRISGGAGCIASNHFLGAREALRERGLQNLLTGCYCDYLFKSLAMNTVEEPLSRRQEPAGFRFEFYRPHYPVSNRYSKAVGARLEELFPEWERKAPLNGDWHEVERRRSFPLAYEADLAQRVIPQRVLPWYLPIVDNQVLEVYLKIPSRFKLNASIFRKMLGFICGENVLRIPDSNTGAPVKAGGGSYVWHRYLTAMLNRASRMLTPRLATRGSWPNWEYYVGRSPAIRSLWTRENGAARDLFRQILGVDPFARRIEDYRGHEVELFLRLLTQKLWLDQRSGIHIPSNSAN